jgi:hypothetical protein
MTAAIFLIASPLGRGRRAAAGEGRTYNKVRTSLQQSSLTPAPALYPVNTGREGEGNQSHGMNTWHK